jgi:hypothetical protein
MRGPLLSGADSNELPADLDHGRVVDLHVAGHLRLRLGRHEGRSQEKREPEPERPARSFSPDWSHRGFSCMLANTANDFQPKRLRR